MDQYLTVAQLIAKLQQADPSAIIIAGDSLKGEYSPMYDGGAEQVWISQDGYKLTDQQPKGNGGESISAFHIW